MRHECETEVDLGGLRAVRRRVAGGRRRLRPDHPPAGGRFGGRRPAPAADSTAAKPKPKPKPKKPAEATIAVEVINSRAVGLTSLVGAISGTPDSKKIAGPLAAGKKTIAHLAHDKACLFDLHAVFEDGAVTDAQGVELCKDKKINLTE